MKATELTTRMRDTGAARKRESRMLDASLGILFAILVLYLLFLNASA